MMRICSNALITLSCLMLFATTGLAATYFVQQDGSGDFTAINHAIAAAVTGDSILVGSGVYSEQNVEIDKVLHIISINGAEVTTIDGQSLGRILRYVSGGGGTLSGFTITNGYSGASGGAILLNTVGESIDINHCEFINNESSYQGGGISAGLSTIMSISDCLFQGNFAPEHSGAVVGIQGCLLEITRCEFRNNSCNRKLPRQADSSKVEFPAS
jgi:predicted outer membrane repeat protein